MTAAVLVSAVSCSVKHSANGGSAPDRAPGDYVGGGYEDGKENGSVTSSPVLEDRKIIKTVNQTVQTETYDSFLDTVRQSLATLGGYISRAEYSGQTYYNKDGLRSAYLVLHVPAEKLSDFNSSLSKGGVVSSYNESMQDVTGAYIDVESRITVLESEEAALLAMLAKAEDVTSMLAIRDRLTAVQSDLASYRAQKNNYDNRVSYSTVYLRISEVRRAESNNPTFFEEVGGNFLDSIYGIGDTLRAFAVFILGDILYILFTLAVAAAIFFAIRALHKLYKRRKSVKTDERTLNGENSKNNVNNENTVGIENNDIENNDTPNSENNDTE